MRKVNAVSKQHCSPLPRIKDCVEEVGNAKFVAKLDLLNGYWQVPLPPRAKEICTFSTPGGLFLCNAMPFGLQNAPATFQWLMNKVLHGLKALFGRLVETSLTVNLSKCEFAKAKGTYLGKVVGQGKVRPVRAKVEAIDKYPVSTAKKELGTFWGWWGVTGGSIRISSLWWPH